MFSITFAFLRCTSSVINVKLQIIVLLQLLYYRDAVKLEGLSVFLHGGFGRTTTHY